MALSKLSEKVWTTPWADGVPAYPVGPNLIGGVAVDEFDMYGRLHIGQTLAVVVIVSATPTGAGVNGDVALECDDAITFPSPKAPFNRLAVLSATSGRKGNGTGPHLLGYITGGGYERYLRFRVTPHGTTPDLKGVSCYLVPDYDTSYQV